MPKLTLTPLHKHSTLLITTIILFDQITKYWALSELSRFYRHPVFPGFNLSLTWNSGISFGIFQGSENGALWLSLMAVAICTILTRWMWQSRTRAEALPLALVIGGALGNVIDRINHGAVVDFIDVYIGDYHWPAFNIADSAITCGVVMLVLYPILTRNK